MFVILDNVTGRTIEINNFFIRNTIINRIIFFYVVPIFGILYLSIELYLLYVLGNTLTSIDFPLNTLPEFYYVLSLILRIFGVILISLYCNYVMTILKSQL
jgi:hypothetical protein